MTFMVGQHVVELSKAIDGLIGQALAAGVPVEQVAVVLRIGAASLDQIAAQHIANERGKLIQAATANRHARIVAE